MQRDASRACRRVKRVLRIFGPLRGLARHGHSTEACKCQLSRTFFCLVVESPSHPFNFWRLPQCDDARSQVSRSSPPFSTEFHHITLHYHPFEPFKAFSRLSLHMGSPNQASLHHFAFWRQRQQHKNRADLVGGDG